MNGPPANMEPVTLWMELTRMPRPFRVVDFPRTRMDGTTAGTVAMRVLTQTEIIECAAAAQAAVNAIKKKFGIADAGQTMSRADAEMYENEKVLQLLSRACREAPRPLDPPFVMGQPHATDRPCFPSPVHMRDQLSSDEIAVLATAYTKLQYEIGPIVADLSDSQMEAWLQKLGEGGSRLPLASLSSAQLEDLLMYSAGRLYPRSTPTTSAGSPPDAPTSPTPNTLANGDAATTA